MSQASDRRPALFAALAMSMIFPPHALADAAPESLVKAKVAFAKAVAAKDAKALEGLTHFPLANAVYGAPDTIPRANFGEQVKLYWHETGCLKTGRLKRDIKDGKPSGEWLVACDGGNNIFYFRDYQGRWLHSGFENVGE